jgi:hypothetical protein
MNVQAQIDKYIADQSPPKSEELQELHRTILRASPNCNLSFSDGRDGDGKIVSNPTIGYGLQKRKYANGEEREFFQVGVSGNATGISVYVMGIDDKQYLSRTYGDRLGKAKITGYCIKFRHSKDINLDVLEELVANHMGRASASS